jgi:hypothetical protein
MARLADDEAAGGQDPDPGRRHPSHDDRSSTRVWWLIGSCNSRSWSAARTSIAGTDCGFAQLETYQRVHPQVMWAKLNALD